jgi:putative N6-adenine-specific DNA methylase
MPTPKQLPARELTAVCAPGLEDIAATELAGLGWSGLRTSPGVISAVGGAEQVYRACLASRTITDLRVRVGRLSANSLGGLAQGLGQLPWSLFAQPGQPVEIDISSRGSRLKRKDAIARKAQLAIGDALRGPRVQHRPGQRRQRQVPLRVMLRIEGDRVEASVDPAGDSLWKRGYRGRGGGAPLRENLAAACLVAMNWDGARALMDPFCGSGTILIEAAMLAAGRAPGAGRSFAFEAWPCHAERLWRKLRAERLPGHIGAPILRGFDADADTLRLARSNADRAGVGRAIRWGERTVDRLAPPAGEPGLVLCNPPWGLRLGSQVRGVYTALGRAAKERLDGWELGVLCPDRELVRAVGIPMEPRLGFPVGGKRLTLWAGRVRAR